MTLPIVLASGSPRRAEVLRQLGLEHVVRASDADESYEPGETPAEHVERLARAKAQTVALGAPGALVIGGDTVVVDGSRVLGKPATPAEASATLRSLSGREHAVLSGVAIAGPHGVVSAVSRATVRFRVLEASTVDRYVATGEPMDKAGAYGIQGLGAALVESIDGDYYCVVGFPVHAFLGLLERAGWRYDFGGLTPVPPA